MKNKTNIALVIFVIIAILEFIFLQDITEKIPQSREVIWRGVKNLGFGTIVVALFIAIIGLPIIVVYYVSRCIKSRRWDRKYLKAQKQILDESLHWPGHHKATEKKKD